MPRLFLRWAAAVLICATFSGCAAPLPAASDSARSENSPSDLGRSKHGAEDLFEGPGLALAIAAEHGQTETIRRLMREQKVDPDTIFAKEDGMPLVAWPVYTRNPEGLKAMLENGADPNARRPEYVDKQYDDGSGGRYFSYENAMVYAAKEENPIYLRRLLEHGGDPNTRNSNNEPLTYVAFITQNQWQNVKLLIEGGADIEGASWSGRPIDWYSRRGGFEQTYWLLQRGADPTHITRAADPKQHYMPVVADIYWHPGSPATTEWQRKCQHWLRDKGISRPPMPEHLREMRKNLKFPFEEKEIPLL
jgi:uncharacterized protein